MNVPTALLYIYSDLRDRARLCWFALRALAAKHLKRS